MSAQPMICPFCNADREIIRANEYAFALFDKYPVSNGHALIIPKVHTEDYFSLPLNVQFSCVELLNKTKEYLQNEFNPAGFNVGINIGRTAGQTIDHVHIHLIPRYINDVDNPAGGVRGVIPNKKEY